MAQTRAATTGLKIVLSGKAEVFCVHDRKKREVVTEEHVMELAKAIDFQIRPGIHFMFKCSCCENLFVDEGTEPRYCLTCRRDPVHGLGGPLPEPEGVVG